MPLSETVLDRAFGFLVDEGAIALQQVVRATEYIWSRRRQDGPPAGPGYFVNDGQMINALRLLVTNFGLASTLLFDNGSRRSSESAGMFEIRMDRVTRVAALTSGFDSSIFSQRSIRNKFAHVDEHMAKALVRDDAGWLLNIGLSHRALVKGENDQLNYCRVYIFDEDKLLHLQEEFDVRRAYNASRQVLTVLPPAT
jgi:hypothetical protein